jgi:hypothetical protein
MINKQVIFDHQQKNPEILIGCRGKLVFVMAQQQPLGHP